MEKRGRPPKTPNKISKNDCIYCEGIGIHWGCDCPSCDGTGEERVRRQLQKLYNSKNSLPIYYNVNK